MPASSHEFTARRGVALLRCAIVPSLVLLIHGATVHRALAQTADQQFKELRTAAEFDRRQAAEIRNQLRAGNIGDRNVFTAFYTGRVEEFTHLDKLDNIDKLRANIKRIDLRGATGAAHRELNALLLEQMTAIAKDKEIHPWSRYNAVLLIGTLDEVEPQAGGAGAVPLPDALPVLFEIAQPRENASDIDDLIQLGAAVGLMRHARDGIRNPDDRTKVARWALELLSSETPKGRSANVHDWFRLRGVYVLRELRMPGIDRNPTSILDALLATLSDDKATRTLRATAAETYGHLSLGSNAVPFETYGRALAALALDIANNEKRSPKLLADLIKVKSALRGRLVRRDAYEGGLIAAANSEDRQKYSTLADKLDGMIQPLVNHDPKAELPEPFREKRDELQTWAREVFAAGATARVPRNERAAATGGQ